MTNGAQHWQTVYKTKQTHEVSWTQEVPFTSLQLVESFHLKKNAKIIDVGGGDSKLVDHLLDKGYTNLTVLDISAEALQRAKRRLGEKASLVNWIVSDINDFSPATTYDLWHDRAAFHFLTSPGEINNYVKLTAEAVKGFLAVGTFSLNGPKTCSGLNVKQYAAGELADAFQSAFRKIKCFADVHETPFHTRQEFMFCTFRKSPSD